MPYPFMAQLPCGWLSCVAAALGYSGWGRGEVGDEAREGGRENEGGSEEGMERARGEVRREGGRQ